MDSDTAGFDKSRYLFHMVTKFGDILLGSAKDLGNKIAGTGIKTDLKRNYKCEKTTSSKAMLAIDELIPDKSRKGLGFASINAISTTPLKDSFAPPTLDLSNSGLEEFQQLEFEGYGPKISKSVSKDVSNEVRKSPDAPLVEELVLDVDKFEKKTVFPTKIEFVKQQEKLDRKPVKYAEMYRS
ncbi:hypothetical protein Tco_0248037 [Tanacetum coccineum]